MLIVKMPYLLLYKIYPDIPQTKHFAGMAGFFEASNLRSNGMMPERIWGDKWNCYRSNQFDQSDPDRAGPWHMLVSS